MLFSPRSKARSPSSALWPTAMTQASWRLVRSLPSTPPRVSAAELTKLAGTPHHQGVVGVWDKMLTLQKCADPRCPGHASSADFCEIFANQFPDGPLR